MARFTFKREQGCLRCMDVISFKQPDYYFVYKNTRSNRDTESFVLLTLTAPGTFRESECEKTEKNKPLEKPGLQKEAFTVLPLPPRGGRRSKHEFNSTGRKVH